jgi:hypothetical protein
MAGIIKEKREKWRKWGEGEKSKREVLEESGLPLARCLHVSTRKLPI